MESNWVIKNKADNKKTQYLAEKFNVPKHIIKILLNRDFDTEEEIKNMLYPELSRLYNPFLLKDMEKAINRIKTSIDNKEKVLIYGDYDVDGITSTSIMILFYRKFGIEAIYYIPNRTEDGYGLSKSGIDFAIKNKISLIITVDCGITGFNEVNYANNNNIDVIITDHHEVLDNLPNAIAVVNPHRYDDKYPFKYLAGCGVVLKIIQAYAKQFNIDFEFVKGFLDMVTIGTIADVVPLIDENRIITYFGLKNINKTTNMGIRALCEVSGCDLNNLNSFHIGFILAPRINAMGRISDASEVVKLFITEDETEAKIIAREMNLKNTKRKQIDQEVYEEAIKIIEEEKLYNNSTIILANKNWHEGVIGIVASRIVEKYYKPTIMISLCDNIAKGSGRSIPDFHMYNALLQVEDLLESFGGHKLAAGISIKSENLEAFKFKFEKLASKLMNEQKIMKSIEIDSEIEIHEIDDELEEKLKLLSPFGFGNVQPVFMSSNVNIIGYPIMFKQKHLRIVVGSKGKPIDAIWFNNGKELLSYLIDNRYIVDLAYYIKRNNYQGKSYIQLQIKDIRIRQNE